MSYTIDCFLAKFFTRKLFSRNNGMKKRRIAVTVYNIYCVCMHVVQSVSNYQSISKSLHTSYWFVSVIGCYRSYAEFTVITVGTSISSLVVAVWIIE